MVNNGIKFGAKEYLKKTPEWAVYNSSEKGFDPKEERFFRKGKNISEMIRLKNYMISEKKLNS